MTESIRTIQISPFIYAQGKFVTRHPQTNEATIDCEGKMLRGVLVGSYRYGRKVA